ASNPKLVSSVRQRIVSMYIPANLRSRSGSATLLETSRVVMLHGTGNSGAMWRRVAEALPPGFDAVTPDLIGYGDRPAWRAETHFGMADEVRAVATALPQDCGGFHLLGYSYGGMVALGCALAAPHRVRSLTLIEPVFPRALAYRGEDAAFAQLGHLR